MAERIPNGFLDLFTKKTYAHLATLVPDGSPRGTPVWIDPDAAYVLINNVQGSQKVKNLKARPQVALSIPGPGNPFRDSIFRGVVVASIDGEEAEAHIKKLSQRYAGSPYQGPKGSRRLHKIDSQHVITSSPRR